MKTFSQENQRDGVQPQPVEQAKEKLNATTAQPIEMAKKGQVCACLCFFFNQTDYCNLKKQMYLVLGLVTFRKLKRCLGRRAKFLFSWT